MVIRKDQNIKVTKNFSMQEFYNASRDQGDEFVLSTICINALQYIREYFNEPITITSTRRSKSYNAKIGGSTRSQHITGNAIDWQFTNNRDLNHEKFYKEIIAGGVFLDSIIGMGILGIGIYKDSDVSRIFVHIDDGQGSYNKRKKLTAWDGRKNLSWGGILLTSDFINNIVKEDDNLSLPKRSKFDLFMDKLKSMDNDEIFKKLFK